MKPGIENERIKILQIWIKTKLLITDLETLLTLEEDITSKILYRE